MRKAIQKGWVITNKDGTKFLFSSNDGGGEGYVTDEFRKYGFDTVMWHNADAAQEFLNHYKTRHPDFKVVPFEATIQIWEWFSFSVYSSRGVLP